MPSGYHIEDQRHCLYRTPGGDDLLATVWIDRELGRYLSCIHSWGIDEVPLEDKEFVPAWQTLKLVYPWVYSPLLLCWRWFNAVLLFLLEEYSMFSLILYVAVVLTFTSSSELSFIHLPQGSSLEDSVDNIWCLNWILIDMVTLLLSYLTQGKCYGAWKQRCYSVLQVLMAWVIPMLPRTIWSWWPISLHSYHSVLASMPQRVSTQTEHVLYSYIDIVLRETRSFLLSISWIEDAHSLLSTIS